MTQGKLLPIELQQQVLTYVDLKKTPEWIMKKLKISKTSFYRIKSLHRIKHENEYKTKPGRKEKISKSQKMRIQKELKSNPRTSLNKLKIKLKLKTSLTTISKVVRSIGIHRRKMRKIPKLTPNHKTKRMNFALSHCDPNFNWSKWIWTDEKKFNLDGLMVIIIIGSKMERNH